MNNVLYLPMLGLVTLTVVVWGMAVYRRVREIRVRRIPLQSLAQARQVAVAFEDVQAMDNFNNLLQVPVLFYVLCLAVAQSGVVVSCSWPAHGLMSFCACCIARFRLPITVSHTVSMHGSPAISS
jgi:hypothetical protein